MTHTSWINERGALGRDNERLEYLGDAVLELVAAEYLFNRFPNYDEGQLTQMRSSLVSTVALAGIGEQLRLGEALRLGRGATKSGARRLTSLHANAFEAIIGATFLDQGYRKAGKIFLSRIGDLSSWTDPNFKGRLQALAQERYGLPPIYRTLPDGNARPRQYLSQVSVEGGPTLGEGRGSTKQAAEQGAARAAIDGLVAPISKKRRRGSRAAAPLAAPLLEPVGAELRPVIVAESPAQAVVLSGGVEPPTSAVTSAPARRRRRRSGGRSTPDAASAPALGAGAGATLEPVREEAAPPPPSNLHEPGAADPDQAPVRRRRRRSRSGSATAAAEPPAATVTGADASSSGAAAPPPDTELTGPVASNANPAPARRRRRSRAGSAESGDPPSRTAEAELGRVLEVAPEPDRVAPEERPNSNPDEPAESGPRKRTHRGHRGGRRRSGRPATPTA